MMLFCDNIAAIENANNLVQHDWTKHIELDRNYIKDNLDSSMIKVSYIKSTDQLADMLTHVVTSGPFYASLSKLDMCDIYAPMWEGKPTVGAAVSSCWYNYVQLPV